MGTRTNRRAVERHRATDYLNVADSFYLGAEVAAEFEHWNAAGVLIVHAAIAFADAVSIRIGGVKSQGDNHYDTIALLEGLIAREERTVTALNQLRHIIDHKNVVSYSGELFERRDVDQLWKLLIRFRSWALEIAG
ncbi:MAG: hypothetical protein NTV54_05285 [Ignavibacteriales bacterium]|nr:hypothetical protein [Ignavibacteriales bacterium]